MNRREAERTRSSSGVARGYFITLEGIEGSGKSTQARRLVEGLAARGTAAALTREPGGTALGEAVRGLLLGIEGEAPEPEAELYLILAARAQHVRRVILPRLNRGEIVVSDRFADASLAYQGGGRGLGFAAVSGAGALALAGVVPDLTLLCDLSVEAALARVGRRRHDGGEFNRFDRESLDFHHAVAAAYRRLADEDPARFTIVDAARPEAETAEAILEIVEPRLERRRADGGLI
jgi:dTMP kinase